MAGFDFILPISKKDLLKRTTTRQYVVEEIIEPRHLPGILEEFRVAMKNSGYLTILQKFDIPFSILCSESESSQSLKDTLWQTLLKGLTNLANALQRLLQESSIPSESQSQHLNCLKMFCYLICQLADGFEAEETKIGVAQGRKKKITKLTTLDWDEEREYCLKVILQIVEMDINRLWDPPVAEEEFISLITGFCYKLLENPNISRQKCSKDIIANILGTLVKRHSRALSASLRIIQLLQHFEHTVVPLTGIVEVMVTQYGTNNVVFEIMREIGRLDAKDLSNDSSGTRAYSQFLVELAAKVPAIMLQNISFLMSCLEIDSYVMRNCLLSIMKEIVIHVLSKEDLELTLKNNRDQFFAIMKEHIHDVHAYVRGKVLQNWQQIVRAGCLPLSYQEGLVSLVVGRLSDKSAHVRRYAIQLFTALLQSNPYASNFQELKANYNKENDKLEAMLNEKTKSDDPRLEELEKNWAEHENDLQESLKELPAVDCSELEKLISEDDTIESLLKLMVDLIEKKEYLKCYQYLCAMKDVWPDKFQISFPETSTENCSEEEGNLKDVTWISKQFKTIYIDAKKADLGIVCSVEQVETEQSFELKKQEVLVMYLRDSLTFSSQLKEAVPLMCKMLRSKVNSDVMEAIEFFTVMFEFGLSDALKGIRQILLLLYSTKDAAIKEAAVNAYKRIYLDPKGGNQRTKALKIINNLTALINNASLEEFISLDRMMCQLMSSGEVHSSVIQMLWERFTMKVPNTTPEESRCALVLLTMAAGADTEIIKRNISVLVAEGLGPRSETDFKLARDTCLAFLKIGMVKKKIGEVAARPFRLEPDHDLFVRLQELLLKGFPDLENKFWIPFCEKAINVIYKLSESPDHVCATLTREIARKMSKMPKEGDEAAESGDHTGLLTRFVSLIGNITHRQFEYLEKDVLAELKRRATVLEKGKAKNKKCGDRSTNTTSTVEEELSMVGASAEDDEADQIRKVCEKEILVGDTFLATVAPLIVDVCRKQSKYCDPDLRTAACLALSKLMLISSEFCDDNLQLLFTILEKSSLPRIRSNTIIALGDLAFLYPNQIEPWTAHMYSRLRDPSSLVRRSTVSVLSHLILNDMVKVKGQISEMATCIIDEDEKIQGLAKVFFMELSKKGNAVYNVMADIISRLSDSEIGVEETQFQIIMKYLFTFIQKDKQSESLVEKLCQRFRVTKTERQWKDLAFCLSLLSFNEKAVRKLQENFTCYGDKLADEDLYHNFIGILKKARTKCKTEFKTTIDELEAQIVECHNKGLAGEEVDTQSAAHVFKTPAKTPARTRKTTSKPASETPDKPQRAIPKRTPKSKKSNKVDYFSSESDSENEPPINYSSSDSESTNQQKLPATKVRVTRKRRHTPLQILNTP